MVGLASRSAVCTVAPAAVQQATQEARGVSPRQSVAEVKTMAKTKGAKVETGLTSEAATVAGDAHVRPKVTVVVKKGPDAKPEEPAQAQAAPVAATETAQGAAPVAAPARKRAPRPKRTYQGKRLALLTSLVKRFDRAMAKVAVMVTSEDLVLLGAARDSVTIVRTHVAALPEDWRPPQAQAKAKPTASRLEPGTEVVVREKFATTYAGVMDGPAKVVANRSGMIELQVPGRPGPVFIPRGHLIPVAAMKEVVGA